MDASTQTIKDSDIYSDGQHRLAASIHKRETPFESEINASTSIINVLACGVPFLTTRTRETSAKLVCPTL